jgi:hypothetical protein
VRFKVRPETFRREISWSDYNDATLPIRPGIVVAQSIELWLNIRIDFRAWIDARTSGLDSEGFDGGTGSS